MMIYNDPVGGADLYAGLPRANLILVSHRHGDHFTNATLDAVRMPGTVIVAPPDVFRRMTAALQEITTSLPITRGILKAKETAIFLHLVTSAYLCREILKTLLK